MKCVAEQRDETRHGNRTSLDGSASIRPSIMIHDVFISPRKNPPLITFLQQP